ncbi:unnamed protein product, partial [Mesorhabditis spiculigera]
MLHCVFLLSSFLYIASASQQTVAVEGIVVCNGKPYKDAKIKIYEKDTLHDDELARVYSDANGHFKAAGTQSEFLGIQAHMNLYHKCDMPFLKRLVPTCYYKAKFTVPSRYISTGSIASETWNAQTIELSLFTKETDCLN